ncbi:MAG: hypothetical protein KC620_17205, partial [Myxococcales bacterium]|nr:hypothetical protein [Myxococcales bacterium]
AEPPPPERGAFVDSGPVSVETPPPPEDEAWYQQWWVWTLAGVVVIGGTATGGYFLLQDEGHSGSFDAKVSWR